MAPCGEPREPLSDSFRVGGKRRGDARQNWEEGEWSPCPSVF